jgi:hypothetical protein
VPVTIPSSKAKVAAGRRRSLKAYTITNKTERQAAVSAAKEKAVAALAAHRRQSDGAEMPSCSDVSKAWNQRRARRHHQDRQAH